MVETWNELHEGTDVCDTVEYGRQYIELTAEYAKSYKAAVHLRAEGSYQDAPEVSVLLTHPALEKGLRLNVGGDGNMDAVTLNGVQGRQTAPNPHTAGRYAYFDLDSSFAFDEPGLNVRVQLTYFDGGCDAVEIHYDSNDPKGSVREGAFKSGGRLELGHTKRWKTASFDLSGGRFADRCNGADFRLAALGGDAKLAVSRVVVTRR
jgi:hypothetical protein